MDAASTQQIPRAVVTALDDEDSGPTSSMPSPHATSTPSPRPAEDGVERTEGTQPLPSASGDVSEEMLQIRTEGIVPTVYQSRPNMRSLSQRLGGE
jgi:hypothetical protein